MNAKMTKMTLQQPEQTRFATYARYSMDLQNPASIEDQERDCRADAHRREFEQEVRNYADRAVSGSGSDDRPEFLKMMKDATSPNRDFDVLLVDDTSRFSRLPSDTARFHEILKYHGVRVICVSQGIDTDQEQSEMQLQMHSIIDSTYVRELGKKTHRGLKGRFLKGRSAGGRCYGYDTTAVEDGGKVQVIDQTQAAILREFFEWRAAGLSIYKIVAKLNDDGIPPPQKRKDRPFVNWCPTAVRAMLRNELYIGKRIWDRTRYVKAPGTNKRTARPRPRSEWTVQEVPELRIISDDLWNRVRLVEDRRKDQHGDGGKKPVSRAASSPYLLSGILTCGTCGAKLIIVSGGKGQSKRYGCPQYRSRSACSNRNTIRQDEVEAEFFEQLQRGLNSEAVDLAIDIFMKEQKKKTSKSDHEKRIREIKNEQANLVAAIKAVGHSDALVAALKAGENEIRRLSVATAETPQLTRDQISAAVRGDFQALPALLHESPERAKAKLAARIDRIRMMPQPDGTYVVEGEYNPWVALPGMVARERCGGLQCTLAPISDSRRKTGKG